MVKGPTADDITHAALEVYQAGMERRLLRRGRPAGKPWLLLPGLVPVLVLLLLLWLLQARRGLAAQHAVIWQL